MQLLPQKKNKNEMMVNICQSKGISVQGVLGDGAQGVIFNGVYNTTRQACVIKEIELSSKQRSANFGKEIEIMQILKKGDNIIQLQKAFLHQSKGYIVMEKLDGDLMDYILQKKRLAEDEAKFIFRQLCQAVQHCHRNHVAHLDLKPENVLLKFFGNSSNSPIQTVKLCDFGHSYNYSQFYKSYHKRNAHIKLPNYFSRVGTEQYRSPESHFAEFVDVSSIDIWSLGIILFVMTSGFFPHAIIDKTAAIAKIDVHKNHIVISETRDAYVVLHIDILSQIVSDECFDLLEKILQAKPEERLTIDEILEHEWLCDISSPSSLSMSEVGAPSRS